MANHLTLPVTGRQPQLLSEEKKLLDSSPDLICAINADGYFTYVNAAAKQVLGYEPEELMGTRCLDLVIPEDHTKTCEVAKAIMHGISATGFENRYRKKDGTVIPVLWSARWEPENRTMYCVAKNATAFHQAEEKAKRYEERLYKAYKLVKIGWWEWHAATDEYFVSDELYEIYGLNRESLPQFKTDNYLSMVHPEDLTKVLNAMDINVRQEQFRYEHRMIKPSGEVVYVIHYVESTVDENGNLVQVYGITKDITERKLVEEKLRISEQKLTTILESIGDCFYAVDRNWTVTYWNRKTEEVMNKSRKEILGKNFWDIYPPATKLKFFEAYHEAMRSGKVVQFEEYVHPLNRWLEVSAYPSAEGLSVYFKDITARKNDQEELKKSNARYSLVSKATSDAIWDWDLQVNEIYWGEGFETIFGYPLCELLCGMSAWTENIHPDDRARVVQSLERLFDGSDIHWSDEYRFRKKGGQYAIVSDRGFVIRDENGKAVRMVGALQDITHQKEAESALRLSEERFKLLFFESPKPKWMFDEQSLRIVEVNKAATDLYGYSREEFLQLTIADLKLRDDVPELLSLRKQGITQYHNLVRHRKKNGDVFPIEISSHAIALPNGRHFIVVGEDMTQRLKLQQMVVDEKIAAQKEVARAIIVTQERERSEIAKELHDNVNQLLTTAKLYVENIDCFPEQRPEFLKKSVCLLQRSISEIRLLSKQLVTPVINDIGFKATVDELLHHYSSLRLFEIELNYDLEEENLDKGLQLTIYRIIQEQLNNIVKYAKASRVTIAVTQEGDKLGVMIRDNGIGFDTTNVVKGLGLNNMKNRAEVFKGKIRISSKTGAGTEVVVAFPYRVRRRA